MRHTVDVFRHPQIFAVLTLWIWEIKIVLREGKLASAVLRVHWRRTLFPREMGRDPTVLLKV